MGKHVETNLPCPDCGSSDALTRYPDGSYCFSCKKVTSTKLELNQVFNPAMETVSTIPPLPTDTTKSIGWDAMKWLRQYGITDNEIQRNDICWSSVRRWLIFPFYGDDHDITVIAWEARNFGHIGPKTYFFGDKSDFIHIVSYEKLAQEDTIVIVEDIISAIKVGRVYPCLCLFGSHMDRISLSRVKKMIAGTNKMHLTFWLDQDKLGDALKFANMANFLEFDTAVINTVADPKTYDATRIRAEVTNALES